MGDSTSRLASQQPVVEGMWGMPVDRPERYMSDCLEILMLRHADKEPHTGELVTGRGTIEVPTSAPPGYIAALGEQTL